MLCIHRPEFGLVALVDQPLPIPHDACNGRRKSGQQRDDYEQRPQAELETAAGSGLRGHPGILPNGAERWLRDAERGPGNPGRRAGGPEAACR